MAKVKISEKVFELEKINGGFEINGEEIEMDTAPYEEKAFHVICHHQSMDVRILTFDTHTKTMTISLEGKVLTLSIVEPHDELLQKVSAAAGNGQTHEKILSPMPGMIQRILISEQDDVSAGDPVVVLNAMKMENVLKSPVSGKVKEILVSEGEQVEKGKVLVQF